MDKKNKIKIFAILAIFVGFFVFASFNPTITGHVTAHINEQSVNLIINQSQNFLLTSDNLEPFTITAFKISGNITGNGQVKAYIDTGKGQRILLYDNIEKRKDKQSGLYKISGRSVASSTIDVEDQDIDKWLIIKPIRVFLEKETFDKIDAEQYLVSGPFNGKCIETCFINMEVSRSIAYRLVFLVENGTILKINEVTFHTVE